MTYVLIAVIAAALVAATMLRIKQLRPKQLTPIAMANQLLRQPDRFFVIVPWYLEQCRQSGKDLLPFIEEAARHWEQAGNFALPAQSLIAFGKLASNPSPENLQELLSRLFIPEPDPPNPLMSVAQEAGSNQKVAVKCLEVIKLEMTSNQESNRQMGKKLPPPNEINNLLRKAMDDETGKSDLTVRVFGDFDDEQILKEWFKLLRNSGESIAPHYKQKFKSESATSKQNRPKAQIDQSPDTKPEKEPREGSDETRLSDPVQQGYPYLGFIIKALSNSRKAAAK